MADVAGADYLDGFGTAILVLLLLAGVVGAVAGWVAGSLSRRGQRRR